jgi:hypothetical protein
MARFGASGDREEMAILELGGRQRLGIPANPGLIQEPGTGGHRHARRGVTEQRELEELAERTPS